VLGIWWPITLRSGVPWVIPRSATAALEALGRMVRLQLFCAAAAPSRTGGGRGQDRGDHAASAGGTHDGRHRSGSIGRVVVAVLSRGGRCWIAGGRVRSIA